MEPVLLFRDCFLGVVSRLESCGRSSHLRGGEQAGALVSVNAPIVHGPIDAPLTAGVSTSRLARSIGESLLSLAKQYENSLARCDLGSNGQTHFTKSPAKNWQFPAASFTHRGSPLVRSDRQFSSAPAINKQLTDFTSALARIPANPWAKAFVANARQLRHNLSGFIAQAGGEILADIAAHNRAKAAKSIAQQAESANREYWSYYEDCDHWDVQLARAFPTARSSNKELPVAQVKRLTVRWPILPGPLFNYAVSKLNWLSANLQQFTSGCLKHFEPQFLQMEFECVESQDLAARQHTAEKIRPSVANRRLPSIR